MVYMQRTQIYLDTQQVRILKKMALRRKTTLSELIRGAIGQLIGKNVVPHQDPLRDIVGLYRLPEDSQGAKNHDDLYD